MGPQLQSNIWAAHFHSCNFSILSRLSFCQIARNNNLPQRQLIHQFAQNVIKVIKYVLHENISCMLRFLSCEGGTCPDWPGVYFCLAVGLPSPLFGLVDARTTWFDLKFKGGLRELTKGGERGIRWFYWQPWPNFPHFVPTTDWFYKTAKSND